MASRAECPIACRLPLRSLRKAVVVEAEEAVVVRKAVVVVLVEVVVVAAVEAVVLLRSRLADAPLALLPSCVPS